MRPDCHTEDFTEDSGTTKENKQEDHSEARLWFALRCWQPSSSALETSVRPSLASASLQQFDLSPFSSAILLKIPRPLKSRQAKLRLSQDISHLQESVALLRLFSPLFRGICVIPVCSRRSEN